MTTSSKIKPTGLWLLHCMMWKTGMVEQYLETLQCEQDDGENNSEGGDKNQNDDDNNDENIFL